MSSLCLLSVDDVYEQDGLAAECLMVHKIKPRLSAAQRLPSGSHVVEACWEYKFRAHGQVNAPPPPSPAPPLPTPLPGVPPGPQSQGWGRQASLCLPHTPAREPGPGVTGTLPHTPVGRGPCGPRVLPSRPRGRERPLSPGHWVVARCVWGPCSLSLPASGGLLLLSQCFCLSPSPLPSHPPLPGCIRRPFRLLRSPSLPLSPLLSPGAGGHRTAAWHQQSMTKTLSFCC